MLPSGVGWNCYIPHFQYRSALFKVSVFCTFMCLCAVPPSSKIANIFFSSMTVINCGNPPAPSNGRVLSIDVPSNQDPNAYLSTVTYACNTGYTMIGSATRTCEKCGTWSGTTPVCQRKTIFLKCHIFLSVSILIIMIFLCFHFQRLLNIHRLQRLTLSQHAAPVKFMKFHTYRWSLDRYHGYHTSLAQRKLLSDHGIHFKVFQLCFIVAHLHHVGARTITVLELWKETMMLSLCAHTLTFTSFSLSTSTISSSAIQCPAPGIPTNGGRAGANLTLNSGVTYSCNAGFEMQGTARLQCMASGNWSTDPPLCESECRHLKFWIQYAVIEKFV